MPFKRLPQTMRCSLQPFAAAFSLYYQALTGMSFGLAAAKILQDNSFVVYPLQNRSFNCQKDLYRVLKMVTELTAQPQNP